MEQPPVQPKQQLPKLPNQLFMDVFSLIFIGLMLSIDSIIMLGIWSALRRLWVDLMVLDFKTLFILNVLAMIVFKVIPQKLSILATPIDKEE